MGARGPGAKPARAAAKPVQKPARRRRGGAMRAERLMAWIKGLTITSGAYAGRRLVLKPWQREILRRIYAAGSDGRRPVRTALISMGRKGGKSTLCAALGLAHLVGPEAVPRGQVVSAAADRGQASIIFAELKAFALADPEIADRLIFRDFNKTVEDVVTGSVFMALSSDARKAHGLSPTVAIADEVAQWRGRDLLDALRTGQGAHAEPLLLAISTRSPDADNPLEELLRYAQQVAEGLVEDPTFASAIYSAPLTADPWAEETWLLANPDADAVRLADIRIQAQQAQRLPSLEASFRSYVLNQPVAVDERFIAPADWDACSAAPEPRGRCYGGLDLSAGPADLTAFALYWPDNGALRVWAFLPTLGLDDKAKADGAPYRQWMAQGHVVQVPGRTVDRAWVGTWIAQQVDGLDLACIAADRWMLNDLNAQLDREGIRLPLQPRGMGFKDQSPSIAAFESAVLNGTIRHGSSPLLRWSVANAAIDMDPAGNRKLAKDRTRGRIDPLVAAVLAVGEAARAPAPPSYRFTGLMLAGC